MSFFSAGRVRSATISRLTSDRTSRSSTTLRSRSSSQISASGSQNPLIDVALADDEPAASPAALQQSGISNACVNVIAEVMGAGMLSLPHCVATLGWIVGLSAVAAFGALSAYSGVILTRTKMNLFPDAESFGDLAFHTVGPTFGAVTRLAVICTWALLLPFFLLATVNSLRIALPMVHLCFFEWSLLASLALLIPLQLQTLHSISYAATLSTIAMVLVIILALSDMIATRDLPTSSSNTTHHDLWPPALTDGQPLTPTVLLDLVSSMCSIVFAYQGQSMYLEIAREMRRPGQFKHASLLANGFMCGAFLLTCAIGYSVRGSDVAGFLPDAMSRGPARIAVGLLLAFHLFIAYLITGQPLHRAIHTYLFPNDLQTRISKARQAGPFQWLCVTVAMLLFSLLLSNAVPFFDQFQALLGSLTGAPTLAGWPALFLLRGYAVKGERLPIGDRLLCCFALYLLTPVLMAMGSASAVAAIVNEWGSGTSNPLAGCLHPSFG